MSCAEAAALDAHEHLTDQVKHLQFRYAVTPVFQREGQRSASSRRAVMAPVYVNVCFFEVADAVVAW